LSHDDCDMATLVLAMPAGTEALKANPNAVKAVLDGAGRAIYFSRAPIPYDRQPVAEGQTSWHHHLGIYAYRTAFLREFASWPVSGLERQESLEQLRAIEAGRRIAAASIPHAWAGKGIDTLEDYQAFVERMSRRAA
jgi:3-deoxy-manno-octulosonate cytidylyltransferase (CMP-KDO synthetase)